MKVFTVFFTVLAAVAGQTGQATDFWWTASGTSSAPGPAASAHAFCGALGESAELMLWAETDAAATLENFSLNIVSTNDVVLEFTEVSVYNPGEASGGGRFEFILDSTPSPGFPTIDIDSAPDRIDGVTGFTISGGYDGWNASNPDDTSQLNPAWLVGSVAFDLTAAGATTLQLEVGDNGINNVGQSVSAHVAAMYDASVTVHGTPADFDVDGDVDGDDVAVWESGFGLRSGADCDDGDADVDGDVDGNDYLAVQRELTAPPALAALQATPEPTAGALLLTGLLATLASRGRRRGKVLVILLVGVVWGFVAGGTAVAQNFTEWNTGAGSWSNPQNWSPPIVPSVQQAFDSARIDNGGAVMINNQVADIRSLELLNGQLTFEGGLGLGVFEQAIVGSGGSLRLSEEASISAGDGLLLLGGNLLGNGRVEGDVLNRGAIAPGNQSDITGKLTIEGDYTQGEEGILFFQIEGIDPDDHDQIAIAGSGVLGGSIIVDFTQLDGFPNGGELQLMSAGGGFQGQFASYQMVGLGLSQCFALDADDFTVRADLAFDPGDMNLDGLVDGDDLPLFALALADKDAYRDEIINSHSLYVDVVCLGDVSANGLFDFDDIDDFATAAGLAVPAVAEAVRAAFNPVPEPTTTAILALVTFGWAGRRPRRN